MGNVSSQPHSIQPHYVYEQEARLATQLLQSPEVRHVVQSLGDFFRHHGDYYKHKRNRHRKKDRWEQDERLFNNGQRQRDERYDERGGRRDISDRKRGCCRDHDSYDERCRCKGSRHDPGGRRPRDPYPTAPQQPIRRPDARGALPHHPSHLRGSPRGHEHAHSRGNPPSVAQFYDDPRPSPPRGRVGQGRPGAPGRAPGAGYHRPPTAETDISEPSRQARYSGLRQGAGGMQDLRPPRRDPRGMGEWQGGQGGGDGRGNGGMGYAGGGVGYAGGEQGYPVGPLDEADD